jgi:hypothetical protein
MKLKHLFRSAILILTMVQLAKVPAAYGGFRPSFRLDYSAWKAAPLFGLALFGLALFGTTGDF